MVPAAGHGDAVGSWERGWPGDGSRGVVIAQGLWRGIHSAYGIGLAHGIEFFNRAHELGGGFDGWQGYVNPMKSTSRESGAGQCTRSFLRGSAISRTAPFRWAFGPGLIAKSWDQHGEACIESSGIAALPSGALSGP